jgi:membrane associated rhomboid family serine protease
MQEFRPSRFEILPLIVKNLLIINGLMYLATVALAQNLNYDLSEVLGLHYFISPYFKPFQLLTHMFMHGSFMHLFSNMFALWMFGSIIENVWGSKRFLIFYLICGFGGAFAHLGFTAYQLYDVQTAINYFISNPTRDNFISLFETHNNLLYNDDFVRRVNEFYSSWIPGSNETYIKLQSRELAQELATQLANIPVVGASGAVFGVLLAFGMLFPNTYIYLYFFIPMKAKYFVMLYGFFELYAGFSGTQSGIAHFAHLGGMLVGFFLIKYWNKMRRRDFF